MKEHPEDICECGDYRKQHPENGACALNGLGHGAPMPSGDCERFRLAYSYEANFDIYDTLYGVDPEREGERNEDDGNRFLTVCYEK